MSNLPNNTNILENINIQCEFFDICGGCSMQHLSQESQIIDKTNTFLNALKQNNITYLNINRAITTTPWNYRQRARLSVKYDVKKSRVYIGFREAKNSRFIANISSCKILPPSVSNDIEPLKQLITKLSIKNSIPQIEIICAYNITCYIFRILKTPSASDKEILEEFNQRADIEIYLQPKGIDNVYPLSQYNIELYYYLQQEQIKIAFQPHHFTQINSSINEIMVPFVLAKLDLKPKDIILDLFAGVGNFTLPAAKNIKHAIGIELAHDTIQQALANAKLNNINNVEFIAQDLLNDKQLTLSQKPNKIIIDPPRTGASIILPSVVELQPDCIAYISCNYKTFVEDCITLQEAKYYLQDITLLDMFPHTKHFEVIGIFKYAQ